MAGLRIASRFFLGRNSAIVRRCFFGTSSINNIEKDSEPSIPEEEKRPGKINISRQDDASFSIDRMILDSATDSDQTSTEEDTDEDYYYDSEDDAKRQILDTALEFVPEHGWTHEALQRAAEAEGLSCAVEDMFPRGPGDLVLHFIEDCNAKLAEQLVEESKLHNIDAENAEIPKISTTTFIQDALMARLQMIRPYIHSWPQAVRLLLHPSTSPIAMKNLSHMVDDIWYHAGDTSTDLNWYTKRGSLAAIYGASELFMMQDRSEDFQCTKQFVEQRLENANQLSRTASTLRQVANSSCEVLSSAISTVQNVTGFNSRRR